jgi:hypothetical protein
VVLGNLVRLRLSCHFLTISGSGQTRVANCLAQKWQSSASKSIYINNSGIFRIFHRYSPCCLHCVEWHSTLRYVQAATENTDSSHSVLYCTDTTHCILHTHRYLYRFPRSLIVTSLLYVVPEADAKELVAAPTRAKWKVVNINSAMGGYFLKVVELRYFHYL